LAPEEFKGGELSGQGVSPMGISPREPLHCQAFTIYTTGEIGSAISSTFNGLDRFDLLINQVSEYGLDVVRILN